MTLLPNRNPVWADSTSTHATRDHDVGEAPLLRAGAAGHEPLPDHYGDRKAHGTEGEQQIAAPLLPGPTEPEALGNAGAEPVRNGNAGQEQRSRARCGTGNGEKQQQRPIALGPGPGREHDPALDVRDGPAHFAPDQVHPAQLCNPVTPDRPLGEEFGKELARVRKCNQRDIPGVGNVVGERRLDAGPDPAPGIVVGCGVANRAECPRQPLPAPFQNAAPDETGERLLPDRVRFAGSQLPDPGLRVRRVRTCRDLRKNPVEHRIAGRRGISDHQCLEVRVDAVGKGQVQQHRTGECALQGMLPGGQVCARPVAQQQEEFFGECQHALLRTARHGRQHGTPGAAPRCVTASRSRCRACMRRPGEGMRLACCRVSNSWIPPHRFHSTSSRPCWRDTSTDHIRTRSGGVFHCPGTFA